MPMLCPDLHEPVPLGPGEVMESSSCQNRRTLRTAIEARSPPRTPLPPVAGPDCLHQTGREAVAARPLCSHHRCRVLVRRRQRRPAGRRRLGSKSQSVGSALLGLVGRERGRGMHCRSEEVAAEASSAAGALRLPSTVAAEDCQLGPYHRRHLSVPAAEEDEQ